MVWYWREFTPPINPHQGGRYLLEPVELLLAPAIRVQDLFVRPDVKTGRIRVQISVRDTEPRASRGFLEISVAPAAASETLMSTAVERELATEDTVIEAETQFRWCLFPEPTRGYAGRSIRVEATLATEDVLKPGDYPVRFRITGPKGILWERGTTARASHSRRQEKMVHWQFPYWMKRSRSRGRRASITWWRIWPRIDLEKVISSSTRFACWRISTSTRLRTACFST